MQDTCQILARGTAEDEYNLPVESWSILATYDCGFDPDISRYGMQEAMDETEVSTVNAALRLPLEAEDQALNTYRIQITHRFGVALSEQPVYEIVGDPERGPSGLVLKLKVLTE